MEPPRKRRRIFTSNDPDAELHEKRARSTLKLKSRFESIFEKYEKNFDNADEIDLTTGEIVIDNGHIRNMLDEKDVGTEGQRREPSSTEGQKQFLEGDPVEELCESVIPDSQDYETDEDDPLATMTFHNAFCSVTSQLKQGMTNPVSQTQKIHRQYQPPNKTSFSSPSRQHSHLDASDRPMAQSRLDDVFPIEKAWRAPPLPGDDDPWLRLPLSDLGDSGSSRSGSPPGISLWALPHEPRLQIQEPNKSVPSHDASRQQWTQEEDDLLRYFRSSTTLTYNEMCDRFHGKTARSLQSRCEMLEGTKASAPKNFHANPWTSGEAELLRRLKSSTGKSWLEIHQDFPQRSLGAIKIHWQKLQHERKDGDSQSQHENPPFEPARLLTSSSASQETASASNSESSSRTIELPSSACPSSATTRLIIEGADVDDSQIALGVIESDEMRSRGTSPLQKNFPSDAVIPDSQSCMGTQLSVEPPLGTPSSARDRIGTTKSASEDSTIVYDSQGVGIPVLPDSSGGEDIDHRPQSKPTSTTRDCHASLDKSNFRTEVPRTPELIDLTLDDDEEEDDSNFHDSGEPPRQISSTRSSKEEIHTVPNGEPSPTTIRAIEGGKKREVPEPTTSQFFKQIEIEKPWPTRPGVPRATPSTPRKIMRPSISTPEGPRLTAMAPINTMTPPVTTLEGLRQTPLTPIGPMTPSSIRAKVVRVLSLTPQQQSERIGPFTLVLPNSEEAPIERGKRLFPKASAIPRPTGEPTAVIPGQNPAPKNHTPMVEEVDNRMSAPAASVETRTIVPSLATVEDNSQLFLKPAFANALRNNKRHSCTASAQHLVSSPRIGDGDISDDELSTPAEPLRQRVEMTPVRSLQRTERRLSSRF
ncbi:MAG: hypothetical protein Q9218_006410 [Villophora microphyllina]